MYSYLILLLFIGKLLLCTISWILPAMWFEKKLIIHVVNKKRMMDKHTTTSGTLVALSVSSGTRTRWVAMITALCMGVTTQEKI